MSASRAVVLFAHGARDPQWAQPFERIRALVEEADTALLVELAFLERMTPDLSSALARLEQRGAKHVTVVPLFLGAGGHVKEDLAALLQSLRDRFSDIEIRVTAPIGESEELVAAIAAWVLRSCKPGTA
jgi:sirohydrochlorin cobaltochelatase